MLLIAWLFACPAPSSGTAPAASVPSAAGTPAAKAPDSACVADCMHQRMMQAVSIDKIRSDCQVECGEAPKPPF